MTIVTVFKRSFDFQGRSDRPEYWWFALQIFCAFVVACILDVIVVTAAGGMYEGIGPFYILLALVNIIPSIAVSIRRLHDTGRTGWWLFIALIPIVGAIVLLVFYCLPGTPGPNHFGPPVGALATETPPETGSASSNFEKLEQLGRLRDQGVLTQEEFEAQKALLLRS